MSKPNKPPIDNPIKSSQDDVLGRAVVARDFVRSIREIDASQGIVIGVLGAWGRGKSSFINLMREEFAVDPEFPIIEFNPWLFSGSQQLTDVFFREIAAELRIKNDSKFGAIAEGLDKYGDVLSPIALIPWVGAWWDRAFTATKTATTWWNNRKKGSRSFRDEVTAALLNLEQPIVVVIDDIDRLATPEIRDIFKLVRLTASFPNIIYLLAFDRRRVEQALTEDGVPGRDYIEKIVQLSFDLPSIPRELLRSQIFERLDPILEDVKDLRFNQEAWSEVYFEIVEPLIGSLRDVTRLVLSARSTIQVLGSQIETVDLMALEAVRVFRPEIFEELQKVRTTLTEIPGSNGSRDTKRQQGEIDHLLEASGDDAGVIRKLIRLVFPAARQYIENTQYDHSSLVGWKREHRVAHVSFLDLYFGRTAPSDLLAFSRAEKAYTLFADSDALGDYLDSMRLEELEDTIAGLEIFEDKYEPAMAAPASVALLNRIHMIPDRPRGMFDLMRPDIVVDRVVIRLVRKIADEAAREQAASEIMAQLDSYSTEQDFLESLGGKDDADRKLVSEEFASRLESQFVDRVLAGHSPIPNQEWGLFRVYWLIADRMGDNYVAPEFTDPDEIRALVKSGRSVARAQSFDSSTVREEERLAWDGLVRILGGDHKLAVAIEALRAHDGESTLVQLADRYKSGWRPERF